MDVPFRAAHPDPSGNTPLYRFTRHQPLRSPWGCRSDPVTLTPLYTPEPLPQHPSPLPLNPPSEPFSLTASLPRTNEGSTLGFPYPSRGSYFSTSSNISPQVRAQGAATSAQRLGPPATTLSGARLRPLGAASLSSPPPPSPPHLLPARGRVPAASPRAAAARGSPHRPAPA